MSCISRLSIYDHYLLAQIPQSTCVVFFLTNKNNKLNLIQTLFNTLLFITRFLEFLINFIFLIKTQFNDRDRDHV